ncbi:MAG TPA: N-acetylglucosamine-6-phosphate deacetylase, partial [Marmoricola sp.]
MIITAGRVVTPARVFAPGWVHVEGEHVTDVGPGAPHRPADVELHGSTLAPGYVDAHVHGGGGASFDTG